MTSEQEWPELLWSRFRDIDHYGHRFGPELECCNQGCRQTWEQHQWWPIPCVGKNPITGGKKTNNGRTQCAVSVLCQRYGIFQRVIAKRMKIGHYTIYVSMSGWDNKRKRGQVSNATRRRVMRMAIRMLREKGVDVRRELKETRRELREARVIAEEDREVA